MICDDKSEDVRLIFWIFIRFDFSYFSILFYLFYDYFIISLLSILQSCNNNAVARDAETGPRLAMDGS